MAAAEVHGLPPLTDGPFYPSLAYRARSLDWDADLTTVRVHYKRFDRNYALWGLHLWSTSGVDEHGSATQSSKQPDVIRNFPPRLGSTAIGPLVRVLKQVLVVLC